MGGSTIIKPLCFIQIRAIARQRWEVRNVRDPGLRKDREEKNVNTRYAYPADRLSAAWRRLRAPYLSGDTANFAGALQECSLGLGDLREQDLDDKARSCVRTIKSTLETTQLTEKQKHDFSHAVDELAYWFNARLYGID
jgi:hypothetical protein